MAIGLITGALLLGGSFLAGKSGSGGGIEIATSKKSEQITNSQQYTNTSTYAPTISRNYDVQYNIASSGSNISTKKDQTVSQIPNVSPQVTPSVALTPIANLGGGGSDSGKESVDFMGMAVLGAVGFGAYLFLTKDGKKK